MKATDKIQDPPPSMRLLILGPWARSPTLGTSCRFCGLVDAVCCTISVSWGIMDEKTWRQRHRLQESPMQTFFIINSLEAFMELGKLSCFWFADMLSWSILLTHCEFACTWLYLYSPTGVPFVISFHPLFIAFFSASFLLLRLLTMSQSWLRANSFWYLPPLV